jgi:exopolyphosphatase
MEAFRSVLTQAWQVLKN